MMKHAGIKMICRQGVIGLGQVKENKYVYLRNCFVTVDAKELVSQ